MKQIKVKPFGVFKVAQNVIDSIEKQTITPPDSEKAIKEIIRDLKSKESTSFLAILPEEKELFTFIPVVKEGKLFASKFPDPIQLYFSLAYSNYTYSQKTYENITLQSEQGRPLNFINSYLYNWHLQYKISTIIFLHSTVEAFINYSMPDDFIYKQTHVGNKSDKFISQTKEFNKEQTERFIQFKEKLGQVMTQVSGIDLFENHKTIYDGLINLNSLRNDIIHLRSTLSKNQEYFRKVFEKVLNSDLSKYVDSVFSYVNLIVPNFLEFEEISKEEVPTFNFEFESYAAFAMDISVFLKILDAPTKKVRLSIPKETNKNFQSAMNWIMQNLDVMAKKQLILFPTIIDQAHQILIEITKTDIRLGIDPIWSEIHDSI
ncbi:hypothetical protein [Roseivirga pacifica]|uniref:hypothetical protein n=1 Tax=Roseivirga pacifica TaxID=1267423 RepID=UPI003BB09DB9